MIDVEEEVIPYKQLVEVLAYGDYSIRLLHRFGEKTDYMDTKKIAELWNEFKQHDVLFSDEVKGNLEAFLDIMFDVGSIWFEVYSMLLEKPLGVFTFSRVVPGFDALAHFAFWDGKARGREVICLLTANLIFHKYDLHRISADIPVNQKGVIRFAERIGFVEEGVLREGTIRNGEWYDFKRFGLLRTEMREALDGRLSNR